MKRTLILVVVLLFVFSLCACEQNESNALKVETPYCELTLPDSFKGNVEYSVTTETPYTVEFMAVDGTSLFSIIFGGETENLIGTIVGEKANTVVYATFASFDKTNPKYDEYSRYQQGINTIIEHLISDSGLVADTIIDYDDGSTFEIKTSVTTFLYPSKWKDLVTIDNKSDRVVFLYKEEKLFELVFDNCDGTLLGTYKDTPIYVISYTIDDEKYSEEEYHDICSMQYDVNVIIEHLSTDENFSINN